MITVRHHPTELFSLHASVGGFPVYLDLFAVKALAKGDPKRRKRFIAALDRGVEVLFSVANVAELSGPQGPSFDQMRAFLDEIGPHWFPVEAIPEKVIAREREGKDSSTCCFSEDLLKVFTATHIKRQPNIKVEDLPESLPANFFRLGLFMEWLAPQRDSIASGRATLDRVLIERIREYRAKHEADPTWLDTSVPLVSFGQVPPATFVYHNLIRLLILEWKAFAMMPGDGVDFCQAVIGSAFSTVATLDKKWKRRVELLPQPNMLARIYYEPQLDQMVGDIESNLDRSALQRGRALFSIS